MKMMKMMMNKDSDRNGEHHSYYLSVAPPFSIGLTTSKQVSLSLCSLTSNVSSPFLPC